MQCCRCILQVAMLVLMLQRLVLLGSHAVRGPLAGGEAEDAIKA